MTWLKRLGLLAVTAASALANEGGAEAAGNDLWKWVNFGVVALLLGYIAVKTGGPALRERAADIIDSLSSSARRAEAAAAKAAEVDKLMAGLTKRVEELRAEAQAEMAREALKFQAETEALIAKVEANAHLEIDAATKHAIARLHALSAQLALDLAQKKVEARMSPAAQASLVDGFVRSLN